MHWNRISTRESADAQSPGDGIGNEKEKLYLNIINYRWQIYKYYINAVLLKCAVNVQKSLIQKLSIVIFESQVDHLLC